MRILKSYYPREYVEKKTFDTEMPFKTFYVTPPMSVRLSASLLVGWLVRTITFESINGYFLSVYQSPKRAFILKV